MSEPAAASRRQLVHAPQREFSITGNELIVGGVPVSTLMRRSDGRAFYAYDSRVIDETIATLKHRLPERIRLHYAVKANPMPEVVAHVARAAHGLDVASARELALALRTGVSPRDISFAGPGKSLQDLRAAVEAGVILAIESATEARRIGAIAAEQGVTAPCAIRVNPDFELRSSGMKMGGGARPFGIDAEQVPAILDSLRGTALDIRGFHIFSGSQTLSAEAIVETQRRTVALVGRLAPHLPDGLRWLNMGGGLGVPYFPGDQPLDLATVAAGLAELLEDNRALLEETEVVMELGRYLVAAAGVYACRITDRKVSRGTTYLVTNGGLHHNLALSGNFGQVIRKNYPVAIANRMESDDLERVTIVGPLCTPLDLLGEDMTLPKADIGDTVAVFMSGAYGFTASPHRFLSHPEALEFFL